MDECESLDSEMTELQEFQSEVSEAMSQDDEDEMEELQNRCFTYWIIQVEYPLCKRFSDKMYSMESTFTCVWAI